MILDYHDHLRNPVRTQATRLVISHDDGTPLGVVMVVGSGYKLLRAGEPGFEIALKWMGVEKTVVVEPLRGPEVTRRDARPL